MKSYDILGFFIKDRIECRKKKYIIMTRRDKRMADHCWYIYWLLSVFHICFLYIYMVFIEVISFGWLNFLYSIRIYG